MDDDRKKKWQHEDADPERIRVTDRRRVHLDGNGNGSEDNTEVNLKPTYVEELEARMLAAEQNLLEVKTRFTEMSAQLRREVDETRQRLNRSAEERIQRERADFIASLLPVLDNLQRAIEAAESGASVAAIVDGITSTANSFEAALTAAGIEPLVSVGEVFNPELHDAVDTIPVEPEWEGRVVVEYARGYRIGDRLLRPARVQIGRAKTAGR
jgi:molecular chaperone GrpE